MRLWNQRWGMACCMGLLSLSAGCTISIQPWTKPTPPPPSLDGPGATPPYGQTPGGAGAGRFQQPNLAATNEQTSQLIRQLNEIDDHRKALLDQVQNLKKQLKEREENVRQANYEIEESTRSVKKTREEFRQWQAEMEELRARVKMLEDYRATLKPLIEEIIRELDRDKETPKTFKPFRTPPSDH